MGWREPATRRWAVGALGCGGLIVVVGWGAAALVAATLGPYRERVASRQCQSNLHAVSVAMLVYADDYESRLPPAQGWQGPIVAYVEPRRLECPSAPGERRAVGYAMSPAAGGADPKRVEVPDRVPMLFDSATLAPGVAAGIETLPKPPRHLFGRGRGLAPGRGNWVAHVDGSARIVPEGEAP